MTLHWIASIYTSVKEVKLYKPRDMALDVPNTSRLVTIPSETLKNSFSQFIRTKTYRDFTDKNKSWHWYYYDENDLLHLYAPFSEEIEDIMENLV